MPKILLAGNDVRLLGTRAAVLGTTGATVTCCGAARAFDVIGGERFDLVVLCHTLSDEESNRIAQEVHRRWPQTRILQVLSGVWGDKLFKRAEPVVTSTAEPRQLVRRATELLGAIAGSSMEGTASRIPDVRAD